VALLFSGLALGQETLFPAGYDITARYRLSAISFSVGETLTVEWTLANDASFGLTNLFLAENLPLEFGMISSDMSIDSVDLSFYFSGPLPEEEFIGYNTYRWIIDLPIEPDTLDNVVGSGQVLTLTYRVICNSPNSYELPFHTLCCYGDTCGLFSTAGEITVSVSPSSVSDDDDLPSLYFLSFAYPNPANGRVSFSYSIPDHVAGPLELRVSDLSGRLVQSSSRQIAGKTGLIVWQPEIHVASGIYLYTLVVDRWVSAGKIAYVK